MAERRRTAAALGTESSPPPIELKLTVVAGPDEGLEVPFNGEVTVGTGPESGLVLNDPTVSRRHARFLAQNGRIWVEDLGSRNGTFLGPSRVTRAEVPVGSVLTLAGTTGTSIAVQPRWHVREVPPSPRRSFGDLVGGSLPMRELFAILERVAPTDVTVLVQGETGTGKELVARSLVAASSRAKKPYVVFDCGSVPRELAESELFGHKRGAFSGAVADRAGAFQKADGGTLFLDEVGELPIELQPKLLRVLEAGEVRSVGDDHVKRVDVRVVAATNRDLQAEARCGRFRTDLLYRLEVVKVELPPLRQRLEDLPLLVQALLRDQIDPTDPVAGPNLLHLTRYAWPGNVRELRNVLQRGIALARRPDGGKPRFSNLVLNLGGAAGAPITIGGLSYPGVATPMPFKDAKDELLAGFERAYLEALLERHAGHITRAAEAAGLSRKHLYKMMRRHELGPTDPDPDDEG